MNNLDHELKNSLNALRQGNLALARDLSETILKKDQANAGALRLLSQIDFLEGDLESAILRMEKSLKIKPEQYSLWVKLGNALSALGHHEKSENAYGTAINYSKDPFLAYFWRGQVRALLGKTDQAFQDMERAIEQNSQFGQAYRLMVKLGHPKAITPEFIQKLEGKISAKLFQRDDLIHAHYALAGIYEKTNQNDKMWEHLGKANNLQSNSSPDWQAGYLQIVETSKNTFTNEFIKKSPATQPKTIPIFIVGHPRSGSTLLEKMLSAHSLISGGGELDLMPKLIGKIQTETLLAYPNGLEFLEDENFMEFANFYLQGLEKFSNGKKFTTDKLLSNIFFVGLIKKIIPQAKIIYLKRDPKDTAFSIYKNHFWEGQTPEFSSLDWIGKYFKMAEDLMAHWKSLENLEIFEVQYEHLVREPETQMKALLNYIGAPWEENCIDPRKGKSLSDTISLSQVENPVNDKSIGSAAGFEQQMAAFSRAYQEEAQK